MEMTKKQWDPNQLLVGRILSPHGVRGQVKVENLSDYDGRFAPGAELRLEDGPLLTVEQVTPTARCLIVQFAQIRDRDDAARLTHRFLTIPKAEAAPLPPDHFYHWQLIGLAVQEGERRLGVVTDILPQGGHDLYVVQKPAGGEFYLPALKAMIHHIDLERGEMQVNLPPGLTGEEEPVDAD